MGEPLTVTVEHLGEQVTVGKRLYVGNLPYRAQWQDLKDFFKDCGEVVYADVKGDRMGRSAGCGIVEFTTPQIAADAMIIMHDQEFQGRKMFVRQDKDDRDLGGRGGGGGKGSRVVGGGGGRAMGAYGGGKGNYGNGFSSKGGRGLGGRGGGGRGAGGGNNGFSAHNRDPSRRIFVNNLAWQTSWQDLKDFFRQAGTVVRADIFEGPDGRSKGSGIVEFASEQDATHAINSLNEATLHDRILFIREDRS